MGTGKTFNFTLDTNVPPMIETVVRGKFNQNRGSNILSGAMFTVRADGSQVGAFSSGVGTYRD
jgi:hypothetical protein